MLLDIESYVRQLLPANRRDAVHVGLATLLMRPVLKAVQVFNDLTYDAVFDTGTPGQKAVLEFILQSYVHPNISIIDGDGVSVDFQVLVPSPSLYGKARQYVDRYKMAGKRYQVADVVSWGSAGGSTFDWQTGLPTLTYLAPGVWNITLGVNEPGQYVVRIVNQASGKVFLDQQLSFGAGVLNYNVDETGEYQIQVGPLRAKRTAVTAGVVCDLVWVDQNPGQETATALATRWQGGVRQMYVALYSARPDLQPFVTRIYQGGAIVHQFTWNNPQGQWHNLPTLGDGTYEVDVVDKDGCITPRRQCEFTAMPTSALAISSVTAEQINGVYRIVAGFSGGVSPYSVSVLTLSNSPILSIDNVFASPATVNLPSNTPPQTVKVRITDGAATQAEATLPLTGSEDEAGGYPTNKNVVELTNGVHRARYITGGSIALVLNSDGSISDNFVAGTVAGGDTYNGSQRQNVINGTLYNVFYQINGVDLANAGAFVDLQNINLGKGLVFIEKYYVKASNYPDFAALNQFWYTLIDDNIHESVNVDLLLI